MSLFVAAQAISQPVLAQGEIIITAPRLDAPVYEQAYGVTKVGHDYLENTTNPYLDASLSGIAGFSIFRRADSRSSNPTTQGATLRGLGPNGAGRTLVLLDGVPQNDPFGGWVFWSALPQQALDAVNIYQGGGAGPFGAGALSGVIDLQSRAPQQGVAAELSGGSRGFFQGSVLAGFEIGELGIRLLGFGGRDGGFHFLPKDQRGPVDVPASSHHYGGAIDFAIAVGEATTFAGRFAAFADERVNGNALAPNETEALEASLRLTHDGQGKEPSWSFVLYGQEREFAQTFVSVRDNRTTTRPVLDQFDVPSRAFGIRGDLRFPWGSGHESRLSTDLRWAEGETNELFRNLGAGFTRRREAGGNQFIGGLAFEHGWRVDEYWSLTGGFRLDRWRNSDGVRREFDLANEVELLDVDIENQSDWRASSRVGLVYQATPALRVRTAAYTGFRVPTLNELHRPFRVVNDITEANAELRPERLRGIEAGISYEPLSSLKAEITWFSNWVYDAVGNITLAQGPGFFPIAGFVPDGGSLRQRQNVERVRVDGVEFSAHVDIGAGFSGDVSYGYSDARIKRADNTPDLVGNHLIQAPKHRGRVTFFYEHPSSLKFSTSLRFSSQQF
ncbi:MAG: TonB-dependent receptor, partial [Sphingomonadales bacterium]